MQISTIIIGCIVLICSVCLYYLFKQEIRYHRINRQINDLLAKSPRLPGYESTGKEINAENINRILKFRLMWDDTRKTFVKVTEINEEDLV